MSYIEKNLMNGESIVTRAQLHAVVYVWPVVLAIASFVVMGFAAFTESYAYPVGVGVVMLVIALIWAVLIHDNRKYVLTNKRLIEKVGIVRRESREILLRKCEGVQLSQSVLGRILNYGTVTVSTTGDAVNDYNQYCFLCNNRVNVSFYYDRAKLEEKARMYQQALDDLTTAIGMSPKVPVLYIEKCALLLKVNELGECVNTAKQLLSFDAQNVDALRIMGYAQTQSGNKAEGKANLQRAAELGDESAKEILKTIE